MLELTGKTAVITGASDGIGKAIAQLFAERGANVVLVARRENLLKELEIKLKDGGYSALSAPGDVSDPSCAENVFKKAYDAFGSVDILVNNAGISDNHWATTRAPEGLWERVVDVNQTAPFRFCREALKYMTKQGSGAIVNISSIGGVYAIAGAPYSAAKAAINGLTKNIAIQYAGSGIRCNAVCPGATSTSMQDVHSERDEEMARITGERNDFGAGLCQPLDIANAALFFCCDESRYINGQIVVVDRGACV